MNIWLRTHTYEPCSWTYVWDYLRITFGKLGDNIIALGEPKNPKEYVELWWGDPQFWQWSKHDVKARIGFTLSEAHSLIASGRDRSFANLSNVDMIICVSHSATAAFNEAPLDKSIRVAFLGVECDDFRYIERNWSTTFNFLHAGVTQFRKGSWLVPEAFLRAFTIDDDAQLTISSPNHSNMFVELSVEYANRPNMFFNGEYAESPMEVYANHHVYVSPHLAEGFGLMIPEAMATGMACIVSRCSAPREFFSNDYGWWVEMSENYLPVSQCLVGTAGFWRVPSVDSLARVMRYAYENRDECEAKGRLACKYVHSNLTWEQTAISIKEYISEVLDAKKLGNNASIQRGTPSRERPEQCVAIY